MNDALAPVTVQSVGLQNGSPDVGSRLMARLDRDHPDLDLGARAFFSFSLEDVPKIVAKIEASHPRYLDLPGAIAVVSADPCYSKALPWGRFQFQDDQLIWDDEVHDWFLCDEEWTREEIADLIEYQLCPPDLKMRAFLPLAWSVGFIVGWLSALDESQPDDAQAGMVILAALVAPLLLRTQEKGTTSSVLLVQSSVPLCTAGCGRLVEQPRAAGRPGRFCSSTCRKRSSRAHHAGVTKVSPECNETLDS